MDERSLEDWLGAFLEVTENTEPPYLYRLWVGISSIAAALQRKCFLQWGPYTFYPNMYIVLVGPSGARKGTAMSTGYRLLSDIGITMAAQKTTLEQLIRRLGESTSNKQDPKTQKIMMHSSITIFSDELVVFLGWQQYEMMSALCDWYDCKDRWTYDTKNKGTDEVIGVWVNLMGATTPHLIQSNLPLESIGGGLTSRIIFVFGEGKEKSVPHPFLSQSELDLFDDLRNDLEKINLMSGRFHVTESFVDSWTEWYMKQDKEPPKQLDEHRFGGYIQRRPTHMLKLCMVLSASESSDMVIRKDHLERAERILLSTEVRMPQVFRGVGRNPYREVLSQMMTYMALTKVTDYATVMERFSSDADAQIMDRVIKTLEQMKYIKRENHQGGLVVLKYTGPEGKRL